MDRTKIPRRGWLTLILSLLAFLTVFAQPVKAAVPDLYTNDVVSDDKVKDSFREDDFDAGTTRMVKLLTKRLKTHQNELRSSQAVGVNNVLTKVGTVLAVVPYVLFLLMVLFYRPQDDTIVYKQGQVTGWLAHVGLPLVFLFYLSFIMLSSKLTAYVTVGMLVFHFLYLSFVGWQYAQVDSVLQRRADLVPNLTSAVKGSMHNEQKIFGDVAKARSNFNNAKTASDRFQASQELGRSTNILVNAIRENYPQLNSTKRVHDLMIELEGTENRISTERQNYNRVVQQYNTSVTTFPGSLFHRSTVAYFKADQGAKTAPKVALDK